MAPLSQMYISHQATETSVRPYRNIYNLKCISIFPMQEKYQMVPTQTICSKTYTAVAVILSTTDPKQAESWQSHRSR